MRADTESLNAQFERAFFNRLLPAWGLGNQTVIVLMAALAHNAWERHTWVIHAHQPNQSHETAL